MSRGQSIQAFNTAQDQNKTDFSNAQSAFGDTESSIGNYNSALAKFVSQNPYAAGGEYSSTINTGLANTSDAGSNSLRGELQAQALRTGQNSASDAATAASGAQQNTRDLSSDLAKAQQQRISSESGYNQQALGATATPISANQSLYGTSTGASDSALGNETNASKTPSFWDEVGQGVAGNLGRITGSTANGGSVGVCWVAAECWGGWLDPRTVLVRGWLLGTVQHHRIGRFIVALYKRFGERAAAMMRTSKIAHWALTKLCHFALRQAKKEQEA